MASSNTSKTAHVMNLLSKNRPADSAAAESAPAAAPAGPAPAEPVHTAPVAPIISSINADAAVSSQIKDALKAELEDAPVQAPARETPSAQAAPVPEAPPAASLHEEAPAPEIPVNPSAVQDPPQEEHSYVNVMQILVEEKADEYMKMFGICCCDKCRVDVRAYALNHLPPKYVVMSERERVPRLTVYESRFASDITAQLIQACKQVMLTPHHSRPEN